MFLTPSKFKSESGLSVPIPTLPPLVIRILSVELVPKAKTPVVGDKSVTPPIQVIAKSAVAPSVKKATLPSLLRTLRR